MDYKEFEKIVITGHNIDFEYDDRKYSIIKQPNEYNFIELDNNDNETSYNCIFGLLVEAKINEKHLKEISQDMKNIQVY